MDSILIFFLKSAFAMALFALAYRLLLRQELNFRVRRIYLLLSFLVSLVLPWIPVSFASGMLSVPSYMLDEITVYERGIEMIRSESMVPLREILIRLYLFTSLLLIIRLMVQFVRLFYYSRRSEVLSGNNLNVYRLSGGSVSFSFFSSVFIGKSVQGEDYEKILAHEQVHARQLHSLDIIILEVFAVFLWFNPLVWWYRNELRNVHEYLADEGALAFGFNVKSYQITLLEHILGSASISISNQFNYSTIKNRIAMMNKEKPGRKNSWKGWLLLPISIAVVAVYACTGEKQETQVDPEKSAGTEKVYQVTEEMPSFNNGSVSETFPKFLAENLKYPEAASKKGIQGKVYVNFFVDSDGDVVDVLVKQGVDPDLDAEAIRVVKSSSGKWTPGKKDGVPVKVEFTIPITFALK